MSQAIRDWLPDEAFTDEAVKAALAPVIEAWGQKWFSARLPGLSRVRTGRGRSLASPDALKLQGAVAALEISETGKRCLLDAVLAVQLAGQALTENDHKLLNLFASAILEDLIAKFDAAFGQSANRDGARVSVTLSLSGDEILSLDMPQHALVPAIKVGLGGPRRARATLRPRQKALGPTQVEVRGFLGHAELAVDDLQGLAKGDVLILDRALHETVELCLSSGDRPVGRGRLGRNDGRVSIQF